MDGCIAHFPVDRTRSLLVKVRAAMHERSLYVGSERLEHPDRRTHDHLQAWPTARDMHTFLEEFFPYVQTWQEGGPDGGEVFFRCACSSAAFERFAGKGAWPGRASA